MRVIDNSLLWNYLLCQVSKCHYVLLIEEIDVMLRKAVFLITPIAWKKWFLCVWLCQQGRPSEIRQKQREEGGIPFVSLLQRFEWKLLLQQECVPFLFLPQQSVACIPGGLPLLPVPVPVETLWNNFLTPTHAMPSLIALLPACTHIQVQ